MDLIIVESPHKAKTISGILGSGYTVKASVGHIRDLSKKELSVNLETFVPEYEAIKEKRDIISELTKLSQKADNIIIASDPDREGEAIGWHLTQALKLKKYKRAEFHEITPKGVKEGLSNLKSLDMNLVSAQEARRVLDRFIGYGISPDLRHSISEAKSAGRVQTAALRIIVEREKEINAFVPKDKYKVEIALDQKGNKFIADVVRKEGENKNTLLELQDRETAEKIKEYVTGKKALISDIKHKDVKKSSPAPFTTSTYQQAAVNMLGITSEQAMSIAQKLYESGFITYMRTDSVRLSDEAMADAQNHIVKTFGDKYYEKHIYKNKDGSQDAHEAIRPSALSKNTNSLAPDELKTYTLIVNRFLASQMSPAVYDQTVITVKVDKIIAEAKASVQKFKGYQIIYNDTDAKDSILSGISTGETEVKKIDIKGWKTKPPARFTESSIIKELEEAGIGRPSTYAQTIKNLKMRLYKGENGKFVKLEPYYIAVKDKKIYPTETGIKAVDYLVNKFTGLFDIKYTADMEEKLDEIANGKMKYNDLVGDVYANLKSHNIDFSNKYMPSDKQIKYAEYLAQSKGLQLPNNYASDGKVCSDFITANKSAHTTSSPKKYSQSSSGKPTEKQIQFAEKLAKQHNLILPKGYRDNMSVCKDFLTSALIENQTDKAPSDFTAKAGKPKGVKRKKAWK